MSASAANHEAAGAGGPPRALTGSSWRPWLIALVIYAVAMTPYVVWRAERSTDFRDYWRTALHLRQTGQVSSELGVHNYLPCFPILMTPWSLAPLQVAIVGFLWLSLASLALTAVMCERLLARLGRGGSRAAVQLALLLSVAYVHSCAVLGAVELLLLFLLVAFVYLLSVGRNVLAGAALGLAIAIKLLPALLLAWLLLQRRWKPLLSALLSFSLLAFALPAAILGPDVLWRELRAFRTRAVEGHAARTTILADQPEKAIYTNNALPLVLRRLLSPLNANPGPERQPFFVNLAAWPRERIWLLYVGIAGLLGATTAAVSLRRTPPSPAWTEDAALQFGAWCCLIVLLAPLAWTRYLLLAFCGLLIIAAHAARRQTPGPPHVVLTLWLIGTISLAWPAARASGSQLWMVLIVWVACVAALLTRWRGEARNVSGAAGSADAG